jgi:hypothetical protein
MSRSGRRILDILTTQLFTAQEITVTIQLEHSNNARLKEQLLELCVKLQMAYNLTKSLYNARVITKKQLDSIYKRLAATQTIAHGWRNKLNKENK